MPTTPSTFPATAALRANQGLRRYIDGLCLWRRAPFKLFALCLLTLLVEALIQRIPWARNWTLSMILLPLLQYGILLDLDGR